MRDAIENLRRLSHILRVALAHLLAHHLGRRLAASRLPALRRAARRLPDPSLPAPERLRAALEEIGGTFIKLGQMLALQPDILSLEYCNALFKLLDRVEPFGYTDVRRIVVEEIGRPPEEAFDRFDPAPLAAASIGQVHVAELAGRRWAVKVQRPSVESDFAGDIRLMVVALGLIRTLRLRPLEWLIEPLTEFIAWTEEELDYRIEARYMERLGRHAVDNPRERVPEVMWGLTTRRLLVAELLEGTPILTHLRALETGDEVTARRLAAIGFQPDAFARNIIDNFLGDAFLHGIFHADLHPANLMILPDNVVGYLDFGITGVLSPYSRRNLVAMTLAYTRADLDAMTEAFFRVSTFDRGSRPQEFRAGLERLGDTWYERRSGGRHLKKNFTLVMLDMLRLSRATGVWPERDVIKYIRSSIAIDGLIHRFAPAFDVGRYLERVCARHLQVEGLEQALSRDQLLDFSLSSVNLARDGALRGGEAIDRLVRGGLTARARLERPARPPAAVLRARTLRQAAFVLGAGALAALPLGPPEPGLNPFTVAVLLLAGGLAALARTALSLVRVAKAAARPGPTIHTALNHRETIHA